jgi:hypothetical protein
MQWRGTRVKFPSNQTQCAIFLPALSLVAALLQSCGVDEGRKYESDKQFIEAPRKSSQGSAEANPEPAGVTGEVERSAESGEEEVSEIDPNTVVLNARYRARFNVQTALKLVNGQAPSDSLGLARSTIEDRLNGTTENDGLILTQNYGDGVSRSVGKQVIINTPGDQELQEGQPSNSGIQAYDRTTADPDCPSQLVCIDRLKFEPNIGEPMTICYFDASGVKPVSIPYAISPTAKLEELRQVAKVYGPFVAKRYREAEMSCDQPVGTPDVVENFEIQVAAPIAISTSPVHYFQRADALKYTHEVAVTSRRVANDNQAPYLDETIKLQMLTRNLFDGTKSVLAKMVKTVRSSVELPFPVNLIMSMDGLMVDLHFELCENLLDEKNGNYCQ